MFLTGDAMMPGVNYIINGCYSVCANNSRIITIQELHTGWKNVVVVITEDEKRIVVYSY